MKSLSFLFRARFVPLGRALQQSSPICGARPKELCQTGAASFPVAISRRDSAPVQRSRHPGPTEGACLFSPTKIAELTSM